MAPFVSLAPITYPESPSNLRTTPIQTSAFWWSVKDKLSAFSRHKYDNICSTRPVESHGIAHVTIFIHLENLDFR